MKSTKGKIRRRKQVLALKTLMNHAPTVRTATQAELEGLLTHDFIESTVRKEVRLQVARAEPDASDVLKRTAKAVPERPTVPDPQGFLLSSFLLAESFAYLSRQREESLHFCTGVKAGQFLTVDTLIPVGLKSASAIGAEAEDPEVFRILSALERTGHPLTGVFHIHPGTGRRANCPSSVDEAYMKRMSGRRILFGIWTRDGFLRLLTLPERQDVCLFGDGIEDLGKEGNERSYRLCKPGQSILGYSPGPTSAVAVGRTVVGPAREDRRI